MHRIYNDPDYVESTHDKVFGLFFIFASFYALTIVWKQFFGKKPYDNRKVLLVKCLKSQLTDERMMMQIQAPLTEV